MTDDLKRLLRVIQGEWAFIGFLEFISFYNFFGEM